MPELQNDHSSHDMADRHRALTSAARGLVDTFGTNLICPRRSCRRGGKCTDTNEKDFPFCFYHYRGAIRFLVFAQAKQLGVVLGQLSGEGSINGLAIEGRPAASHHKSPKNKSLLRLLADAGVDITTLARPQNAGRCQWVHEESEDALATLARLTRRNTDA